MSTYVDPLFTADRRNVEGYQWSHLRADSIQELHAFAQKIGRNRCWFHRDHYDLTPSFRQKAVDAGAVELSARELSRMAVEARRKAKS